MLSSPDGSGGLSKGLWMALGSVTGGGSLLGRASASSRDFGVGRSRLLLSLTGLAGGLLGCFGDAASRGGGSGFSSLEMALCIGGGEGFGERTLSLGGLGGRGPLGL